MNETSRNLSKETDGFTPAKLAVVKLTLADMPPSAYDHQTQTRKFADGQAPSMLPDTMFDGEST